MPTPPGLVKVGSHHLDVLGQDLVTYKHSSGIRVALCAISGPLCQADIVVATECTNDTGLPHCLEHLVFMGSKQFPDRGYLDKLASLCVSQGTNAWTDRDHTAYNAITAGEPGLRKLLPVLLDHVMHPTLTDEQFATEVFHVDGEGRERGVVFSEMQGREATEDDLVDNTAYQLLYPGTGYEFECGGLTGEIPKLSNSVVRDYHRRHYRPDNCLLLVYGEVSKETVEEALAEWQANGGGAAGDAGGGVVWGSVPGKVGGDASKEVQFPADDETVGSVCLGWSGPHIGDSGACVALEVLFRFLQEGAASPLRQRFVEKKHPMASDVSFNLDLRLRTCLTLQLSGVPNSDAKEEGEDMEEDKQEGEEEEEDEEDEEEDEEDDEEDEDEDEDEDEGSGGDPETQGLLRRGVLKERVMEELRKLQKEGFPQGAMAAAAKRHAVKLLEECEEEPGEALQNYILPELLFQRHVQEGGAGGREGWGRSRLDALQMLEELQGKDEAFWQALMAEWLLEAPCVEVVMIPSKAKAQEKEQKEKESEEKRRAELGTEGLSKLAGKLQAAVEANKPKPFPPPGFHPPPLPPPSAIGRLPLRRTALSGEGLPAVQVLRTSTRFHHVTVGLDGRKVPERLRRHVGLLMECWGALSVAGLGADGSERLEYTEAVKLRHRETVSVGVGAGAGGGAPPHATSGLVWWWGVALPEADGLEKVCRWLARVMCQSVVEGGRVQTTLSNLKQDLTSSLRDGGAVCSAVMSLLTVRQVVGGGGGAGGSAGVIDAWVAGLEGGSNEVDLNMLRQYRFIREQEGRVKQDKAALDELVNELEEVRRALVLDGGGAWVQIGAPGEASGGEGDGEDLVRVVSRELMAGVRWLEEGGAGERDGAGGKERKSKRVKQTAKESGQGWGGGDDGWRLRKGVEREGVTEQCVVVTVKGIESSYVEMAVPCPVHRTDPETAAVMVLAQWASRAEGPLWQSVRGQGLAYHANLGLKMARGQLMLELGEVSDVSQAVKACMDVLRELPAAVAAEGPEAETALAETKAALLFSLHSRRATVGDMLGDAAKCYQWGVDACEGELARESAALDAVSVPSLLAAYDRFLKPLLTAGTRCTVVTCPSGKSSKVASELAGVLGAQPQELVLKAGDLLPASAMADKA